MPTSFNDEYAAAHGYTASDNPIAQPDYACVDKNTPKAKDHQHDIMVWYNNLDGNNEFLVRYIDLLERASNWLIDSYARVASNGDITMTLIKDAGEDDYISKYIEAFKCPEKYMLSQKFSEYRSVRAYAAPQQKYLVLTSAQKIDITNTAPIAGVYYQEPEDKLDVNVVEPELASSETISGVVSRYTRLIEKAMNNGTTAKINNMLSTLDSLAGRYEDDHNRALRYHDMGLGLRALATAIRPGLAVDDMITALWSPYLKLADMELSTTAFLHGK